MPRFEVVSLASATAAIAKHEQTIAAAKLPPSERSSSIAS